MIEINMDERNMDSVMIMLREKVQNGNCRKIHIFEAGESPQNGISNTLQRYS